MVDVRQVPFVAVGSMHETEVDEDTVDGKEETVVDNDSETELEVIVVNSVNVGAPTQVILIERGVGRSRCRRRRRR
jgi:hypothetical protein